jgi:hypothetical protein
MIVVVIPEKTCPHGGGDRGSRNSFKLKADCLYWIPSFEGMTVKQQVEWFYNKRLFQEGKSF